MKQNHVLAHPAEAHPSNLDASVVAGFGDEWSRFDQSVLTDTERGEMFDDYFQIFPWQTLPDQAVGFDLGCGSGRWAKSVAARVGTLHCIDASDAALAVAARNLQDRHNCQFHHAGVDAIPLAEASMDFGYCLGVLHHVPDTLGGLKASTAKLKAGAPFLLYLYYAFDQRPAWFRLLWRMSDVLRRAISRAPHPVRYGLSQALAVLAYWPLARMALIAEKLGLNVDHLPLSAYRSRSFYVMRTDALDRFGTQLEQRFTRPQIMTMMGAAGLRDIRFNDSAPFWCAVGIKA